VIIVGADCVVFLVAMTAAIIAAGTRLSRPGALALGVAGGMGLVASIVVSGWWGVAVGGMGALLMMLSAGKARGWIP